MFYTIHVVTEPETEPVSLDEMVQHLRVDQTAEDDVISGFITAARVMVEQWSNRALITQQLIWTMSREAPEEMPSWPMSMWAPVGGTMFDVPRSPVQSIITCSSIDQTGASTGITDFTLDNKLIPARLRLNSLPFQGQLQTEYWAGYGDTADTVPPPLRLAVKMFAAHLYEHRGDDNVEMPAVLDYLLAPYRAAVA